MVIVTNYLCCGFKNIKFKEFLTKNLCFAFNIIYALLNVFSDIQLFAIRILYDPEASPAPPDNLETSATPATPASTATHQGSISVLQLTTATLVSEYLFSAQPSSFPPT